jgi:alcohol dehydrogenase
MKAVVTTGNGGYEKLVYQDVAMPEAKVGEVLIKVLAAGINNTEINTRLGWYSSSVTGSTEAAAEVNGIRESENIDDNSGGWNKQTPFPFIQGTDCCGVVSEVGGGVDKALVGARVLIRPCIRSQGFGSLENVWMGSDFNGAFAQYVTISATEVFPLKSDWSDAELGAIPCAFGTSENMLHRAKLSAGETVLITGASGGVGSATVQLAKRRGAKVIAIANQNKHQKMSALGIDMLLSRSTDLLAEIGEESIDVVVDNVAGNSFSTMIKLLKRGGRLVSSGAIAGPMVEFDMRDLYLKDASLIGTTAWDEDVFPNLVKYIERGEILPSLTKIFPLSSIVEAQKEFLTKQHVGKFVLVPKHNE